jgi:hypothetical protein
VVGERNHFGGHGTYCACRGAAALASQL